MKIIYAKIKHKNTIQPSILMSAKIVEMKGNHLFFYSDYTKKPDKMVMKVWLKKKYKTLKEALKDVGIEVSEY